MLYRSLEVKQEATPEEIRTAYRRLALQHHPDRSGGTPEAIARFQEIQKAYEVLSDAQRRASYDEDVRVKRAKFKGFVKPAPFPPGSVEKPVGYKLTDESMYTFEAAPSRTHSGWNYGDILSYKDQTGCYVGVGADQWHYWCASGTSYASRLVQVGSSFGTSGVTVMYHCNLSSRPVGAGATAIPRSRPRTEKEKVEGKKKLDQMKQALQQKERARAAPRLVERLITEERAEREEVESELWVKLEDLHSTAGALLRCLEMGVPLPDVGREWLNRSLGTDSAWTSGAANTSAGGMLTSPTEALPSSPSPAAVGTGGAGGEGDEEDEARSANDHFSDRPESEDFSAPDERSDRDVGRDDDAEPAVAGMVEAARARASVPQTGPVPLTNGHARTASSPCRSPIEADHDARSGPLGHDSSPLSNDPLFQSVHFRYTSSCNATSSLGANISYQFHEVSEPPNDGDGDSVLFVDLTAEGDDLFLFTEETVVMGDRPEAGTPLRAQEDGLEGHATSAPPSPLIAASGTASAEPDSAGPPVVAETAAKRRSPRVVPPPAQLVRQEEPHFQPLRTTKSMPGRLASTSRAGSGDQYAAGVHDRSLTSPEASARSPEMQTSPQRPAPSTALSGSHRSSDQMGSLNHFLTSRVSSSGNLFGTTTNTPSAAAAATTASAQTPRATTTPRTTITTTVASTNAMTSLPAPVVAPSPAPAIFVADALLPPDDSAVTSPQSNLDRDHTWLRSGSTGSEVPGLCLPPHAAPSTTDRGPLSKRDATYPWSVSPGVERLEPGDGRQSPSSGSMPQPQAPCGEADDRRGSDLPAVAAGTTNTTTTAAAGAAPTADGGSHTLTPMSAHLSSGGGTARRTPRFMQSTKSYSNRTNGSTRFTPRSNAISPRVDPPTEGSETGSAPATGAATGSAMEQRALSATYSGPDPHAHKSAQQLFDEELSFMKEFEKKRATKYHTAKR